jgi:hypothetical protein
MVVVLAFFFIFFPKLLLFFFSIVPFECEKAQRKSKRFVADFLLYILPFKIYIVFLGAF